MLYNTQIGSFQTQLCSRNSILRLCKLLGNPGGGRHLISTCLWGFEHFALLLNHSSSFLHGLPGKKQETVVPQGKAVELSGTWLAVKKYQGRAAGRFFSTVQIHRRKLNQQQNYVNASLTCINILSVKPQNSREADTTFHRKGETEAWEDEGQYTWKPFPSDTLSGHPSAGTQLHINSSFWLQPRSVASLLLFKLKHQQLGGSCQSSKLHQEADMQSWWYPCLCRNLRLNEHGLGSKGMLALLF